MSVHSLQHVKSPNIVHVSFYPYCLLVQTRILSFVDYSNNQLTILLLPGLMSLLVYLSHSWHKVSVLFIFVSQALGKCMEHVEWMNESINAYIISKNAAYYRLINGMALVSVFIFNRFLTLFKKFFSMTPCPLACFKSLGCLWLCLFSLVTSLEFAL